MALTEKEILDSIVPNIEIDKITLESPKDEDSDGLLVTASFVVYDVVDKDDISMFFAAEEFEKYTNINIERSFGHHMLSRKRNHTSSLSEVFTEENHYETTPLSDGRTLKKFKFTRIFNFDKAPLELVITARSYINTAQIEEDMGLTPDTFKLPLSASIKEEKQVVLKKGQVISTTTSYIYYDANGREIKWNGTRHEMLDTQGNVIGYMTGANHTEESFDLQEKVERNDKIQDFRARGSLSRFEFDSSSLMTELSNIEHQALRRVSELEAESNNVTTELWTTRGISGDARFMMALDIKELIRKKSEYRRYHDSFSPEVFDQLASSAEVRYVKVRRKRVKTTRTPSGILVSDFSDRSEDKIIVETFKKPNQPFQEIRNESAGIKQVDIEQDDLVFLTGTDFEMSEITDGLYSYGYEISVIDPTKSYIENEIIELQSYLSVLESFYEKSISPRNYDRMTNRYTNKYSREMQGMMHVQFDGDELRTEEFMKASAIKYLTVFRMFASEYFKNPSAAWSLSSGLLGIARSTTTSPEPVQFLIDIYNSLINRLSSIVGLKRSTIAGTERDSSTYSFKSSMELELTSSRFYEELDSLFDSNVPKRSGVDYLHDPSIEFEEARELSQESQTIGLRDISGAQWEPRQRAEISRFFSSATPEIRIPYIATENNPLPFSMSAAGTEVLTPTVFLQNSNVLQNNVESPVMTERITEVYAQAMDHVSGMRLPGEQVPPLRASSSPSTPSFANLFSTFNVTFDNTHQLTSILEQNPISASLEKVFESCLTKQLLDEIDPLHGWEKDSETGERLTTPEPDREVAIDFDISRHAFRRIRTSLFNQSNARRAGMPLPPMPHIRPDLEDPGYMRSPFERFNLAPESAQNSYISDVPAAQQQEYFQSLPTQIKAIFAATLPNQQESVVKSFRFLENNNTSGHYEVNLGFMASIEYLSSFDRISSKKSNLFSGQANTSPRKPNLKKPRWSPLTIDAYAENREKKLICRIKRAHYEDLGIRTSDFGIPIYNEYFLITPPRNYRLPESAYRSVATSRRQQQTEDRILAESLSRIDTEQEVTQERARIHRELARLRSLLLELKSDRERFIIQRDQASNYLSILRQNVTSFENRREISRTETELENFKTLIANIEPDIEETEDMINAIESSLSEATLTSIETLEELSEPVRELQSERQRLREEIDSESRSIARLEDLRREIFNDPGSHVRRDTTLRLTDDAQFQYDYHYSEIRRITDEEIVPRQRRVLEISRILDDGMA